MTIPYRVHDSELSPIFRKMRDHVDFARFYDFSIRF